MLMDYDKLYSQSLAKKLEKENKPIVLIGISNLTSLALLAFEQLGLNVDCVVNAGASQASQYKGKPIISLESILPERQNYFLVNCAEDYYRTNILLETLGMEADIKRFTNKPQPYVDAIRNKDLIEEVSNLFCDRLSLEILKAQIEFRFGFDGRVFEGLITKPQYFDRSIFSFSQDEVFIDGGAFTGDSAIEFIRRTRGEFSQIHCFEPEPSNFERLKDIPLEKTHKDKVFFNELGLYDRSQEVEFYSVPNSPGAKIKAGGASKINVVSLDDYLNGASASFIKLDVEGADIPAMQGAYETITKYRPKLCLSLYHRSEHLWEIPKMIAEWVPEYKFYMRHHHWNSYETVLYATL